MKKKSLIETSPYLKDPVEREARIIQNVASSSAIDGISPTAFSTFPAAKKTLTLSKKRILKKSFGLWFVKTISGHAFENAHKKRHLHIY